MDHMQNYIDMTLRKAGLLGRATALLDSTADLLSGKYKELLNDSDYREAFRKRIIGLLEDIEKENES